MGYDLGRTATHLDPLVAAPDGLQASLGPPLSATALRVLTVLIGRFLALDERCDVDRRKHADACRHRVNRTPYTLRELARAAFGSDGGSQVSQVINALDEAADVRSVFFAYEAATGLEARQKAGILSLREIRHRGGHLDGTGVIAWDPFFLESLLEGRFQYIPASLIVGLQGPTAFRVWLAVLLHPRVRHLRRPAQYVELAVSGPSPTIDPVRFGLARQRPGKLRKSLARAAEVGNDVQEEWRLEVVERASRAGGLKLRLTRLREPGRSRAGVSALASGAPSVRQFGTQCAAVGDAQWPSSGPEVRQSGTPVERESAPLDVLETVLRDEVRDGAEDDARARFLREWQLRYPRKPTARQQVVIDELLDRHSQTGYDWMTQRLRLAPSGLDPFRFVMDEDRRYQQQESERAAIEERRWAKLKEEEMGSRARLRSEPTASMHQCGD